MGQQTQPLQCDSSHKQYINEQAWLIYKSKQWLGFACGLQIANPGLNMPVKWQTVGPDKKKKQDPNAVYVAYKKPTLNMKIQIG